MAIDVSEELKITPVCVVVAGSTVALSVSEPLTVSVSELGDTFTFCTGTSVASAAGITPSSSAAHSRHARICLMVFIVSNHPFRAFKGAPPLK